MEEKILIWHPADTPPTLATPDADKENLRLLIELEEGYWAKGEYDAETKAFFAFSQRCDELGASVDEINDNLDWELEEVDNIRKWMWVPA